MSADDNGDPEDVHAILKLLRGVARGENPGMGRDEVAGPMRIETGGMRGRALVCVATRIDARHKLVAGPGEISVRLIPTGDFVFPYGDVTIAALDRVSGAAFVDAMAGWLGTPMDRARSIAVETAVVPITGDYARLGVRDDADGLRWETYKLMLAGDEATELFLRLCSANDQAAFTEKWSAYRERLLVQFDRCLGAGRGIAARTHVDVMSGATLTVQADWIVKPESGRIAITDRDDEVMFEISHQPYPLDPRLPGLLARLEIALTDVAERKDALANAVVIDRDDVELAWTEYAYDATDTKSGETRPARSRILIAANGGGQVLVTFSYWPGDASWAVPEWETIISTLRLWRCPRVVES